MSSPRPRIGIVGCGLIGAYVYEQITSRPELGLDAAFVHDLLPERVAGLPPEVVLDDLEGFAERSPDMVCEFAHPSVTAAYGASFLQSADYLPLSVTAFADPEVERTLLEAAREHGRRLYVPHGAAVGLEAIGEGRDQWEEVKMVMRKSPANIDFSACPELSVEGVQSDAVLYDGPTRGICSLFPRNVNAHAALALGGIGFDRTRSVFIAAARGGVSDIEITARSPAAELTIRRVSPMKGVSGVFTLLSVLSSVVKAKGAPSGLHLV